MQSSHVTAGAHPLICADSYSEESESVIDPIDGETSQRIFGECRKGTFSSKGVLWF